MFKKLLFDNYCNEYKIFVKNKTEINQVYWQECLANYTEVWNMDELDFKTMYNSSLKSSINTRLWKGNDYHPKEVMLAFIDYDKEIVRSIFNDLYNEKRELSGRMERFVFYCGQLLKEIQVKGSKFSGHYHDDYFMVSLYLTFSNPEKYTFYNYDVFSKAMINMGAKNAPLTNELERYYKIVKVIDKFLSEDEVLMDTIKMKTIDSKYNKKTLLDVYDFLLFVANNKL